MTISGSLLDIEIGTGTGVTGTTSDAAALVHDGSTTIDAINPSEGGYGPAVLTDRQTTMVAVAKNDAVTMLVSGAVDYTAAAQSEAANGRIILSAGYDVVGGAIATQPPEGAAAATNLRIGNAGPTGEAAQTRFGASLVSRASGDLTVAAINTATIDPDLGIRRPDMIFAGDVDLRGSNASLTADDAGITVGGNLAIVAGADGNAGQARLVAVNGSQIRVEGTTDVRADLTRSSVPIETLVTGGSAEIRVEASTVNLIGNVAVSANSEGGTATGGTAIVTVNNGTLQTSGGLVLQAEAAGGFGAGELGYGAAPGGTGTGGTSELLIAGGAVEVAGDVRLSAIGFGGGGDPNSSGQGGTTRVVIGPDGSTAGRLEAGAVRLASDGRGGNVFGEELALAAADGPGTGGAGTGGTASILVDGALETASLSLSADGEGGRGDSAFGGDATSGSAGRGGTVTAEFRSGTNSLAELVLSATGTGGDGGLSFTGAGAQAGHGGDAQGGTVTLRSTGGSLTVTETLVVNAFGEAGSGGFGSDGGDGNGDAGGNGGAGIGGTIDLALSDGGALILPAAEFNAIGFGGSGGEGGSGLNAGAGGTAGSGTGGTITASLGTGTLTIRSAGESAAALRLPDPISSPAAWAVVAAAEATACSTAMPAQAARRRCHGRHDQLHRERHRPHLRGNLLRSGRRSSGGWKRWLGRECRQWRVGRLGNGRRYDSRPERRDQPCAAAALFHGQRAGVWRHRRRRRHRHVRWRKRRRRRCSNRRHCELAAGRRRSPARGSAGSWPMDSVGPVDRASWPQKANPDSAAPLRAEAKAGPALAGRSPCPAMPAVSRTMATSNSRPAALAAMAAPRRTRPAAMAARPQVARSPCSPAPPAKSGPAGWSSRQKRAAVPVAPAALVDAAAMLSAARPIFGPATRGLCGSAPALRAG
jgi:hypothetical protein